MNNLHLFEYKYFTCEVSGSIAQRLNLKLMIFFSWINLKWTKVLRNFCHIFGKARVGELHKTKACVIYSIIWQIRGLHVIFSKRLEMTKWVIDCFFSLIWFHHHLIIHVRISFAYFVHWIYYLSSQPILWVQRSLNSK